MLPPSSTMVMFCGAPSASAMAMAACSATSAP
jgi:hypothetical protein